MKNMSAKKIRYDYDARDAVRAGIKKLTHAVKVTLGPRGRNVILNKSFGPPKVTKDGVTVAKEIDLEDPHENIGAQMVKEVASKTSDVLETALPQRPYSPRPFTPRAPKWSPPAQTRWTSSVGSKPRWKPWLWS